MSGSLHIRLSHLGRATLPDTCGSEGWIGIAPDGSKYHVVVPVDRTIARGLKFWIQPDDGTPFSGYTGWHYFCCLTYPEDLLDRETDRNLWFEAARENAWLIQQFAAGMGIHVEVIEDMK